MSFRAQVIIPLVLLLILNGCAIYDTRPTNWQTGTLSASDLNTELYFETVGEGQPVLLIHGFAANTFTWRYLVPDLSRNHKVYLIDLKGFGKSPKPEDSSYTVVDQARLIQKFIRDQDLKSVDIVGHSYGGGVALLTTLLANRQHPGTVRKLVLVDSVAYRQEIPLFIELLATPLLGNIITDAVSVNFQVKNVLKIAYYNDELITEEMVAAYAAPLNDERARKALLSTSRSIIPGDIDSIAAAYPEISIPVKIIWGEEDEIVPLTIGKKLDQALENSSLEIIPKCGHIPQEECPSRAIPVILNFLNI